MKWDIIHSLQHAVYSELQAISMMLYNSEGSSPVVLLPYGQTPSQFTQITSAPDSLDTKVSLVTQTS